MCKNDKCKCGNNCKCDNEETVEDPFEMFNDKKPVEDPFEVFVHEGKEIKTLTESNIVEIRNEQGKVHCMLNHSGDPRGIGPYPAKATLVLKFDEGNIPIHICDVCAVSLLDKNSEWYIFICFGCMGTKWLHKTDLKQPCKDQIQGMNTCPDCKNVKDN